MNEYNQTGSGGTDGHYRPDETSRPAPGEWQAGGAYHSGYEPPPPREPEQPYSYQFSDYETGAPGAPSGKPPKKGKKGVVVFFSIIAVICVISFGTFAAYGIYAMMTGNNFLHEEPAASSSGQTGEDSSKAPQMNIVSTPETPEGTLSDGGMTNESIAAKVSPSTVRIANYQSNSPYGIAGEGTGIIMSADGYIVTNEHVVEGATGIQVTLSDNESYNAKLIGKDSLTDLAVIKLEADPMPKLVAAEFGDSDKLVLGERVLAIGNAGGSKFAGSVTGGMISGVDRQITTESGSTITVLQTDTAINPGNSGGPLINKYGQVIGVNSAKYTAANFEGIGFAIPINSAKPIVDDLISNGRVTGRARLGIETYPYPITPVIAQYMGLPTNISGVMVTNVDRGCDVFAKGIVTGDVIMTADGNAIESTQQLQNYIVSSKKPGDSIELSIYRPAAQRGLGGRTITVSVILAEDTGETDFPGRSEARQEEPEQEDDYGSYPGFPFYPFG